VSNEKNYKGLIITISIVLPLAIAALFFTDKIQGYDFSFLPVTYAFTNGLTFITLIAAVMAIKNGKKEQHEKLMKFAIILSLYFLVAYVIYHLTADTKRLHEDVGSVRYVYFFILITHILGSIAVIPLVLVTYVRALNKRFDKHKKIAKITFPLWSYVSLTGVIVYLLITYLPNQ